MAKCIPLFRFLTISQTKDSSRLLDCMAPPPKSGIADKPIPWQRTKRGLVRARSIAGDIVVTYRIVRVVVRGIVSAGHGVHRGKEPGRSIVEPGSHKARIVVAVGGQGLVPGRC